MGVVWEGEVHGMKCGTDVQQDMAKINSADFASRRNRCCRMVVSGLAQEKEGSGP